MLVSEGPDTGVTSPGILTNIIGQHLEQFADNELEQFMDNRSEQQHKRSQVNCY